MKSRATKIILGVLFFSALWGLSEAVLGGVLYRFEVPYASVGLTVIAVGILAIAGHFLPQPGMLTVIAAFAMLYKFLNTPFFACHLLGILLLGICCDLFFNGLRFKNRSVNTLLAVYLNYTLFAVMITYVFRYDHWVEAGLSKVLGHIFISGTAAAILCAGVVPLCDTLARRLRAGRPGADRAKSFARLRFATVTTGLWLLAVIVFVIQAHGL